MKKINDMLKIQTHSKVKAGGILCWSRSKFSPSICVTFAELCIPMDTTQKLLTDCNMLVDL